jgi:hypothetical protein
MKKLLKERFQELAGIKPLNENPGMGAKYPFGQNDTDVPQEPSLSKTIDLKMDSEIGKPVTITPANRIKDVTISWGGIFNTITFEKEPDAFMECDERSCTTEFMAESEDGLWQFILDVEVAADYQSSQTVIDWDWEELIIQSHPDDESHLDPEDRDDWDDDGEAFAAAQDDIGTMGESNSLREQFQKRAGIKVSKKKLFEQETKTSKVMAAAFLSHSDYKDIYFGNDQELRDDGFEYIEAFTPAPYVFVVWNDESIYSYRYNSDAEFTTEFNEMGYGGCDENGCDINEIVEIIYNSQPDGDSGDGLALLVNNKVVSQGGDNNEIDKTFQPTPNVGGGGYDAPDDSIAGMEDEV